MPYKAKTFFMFIVWYVQLHRVDFEKKVVAIFCFPKTRICTLKKCTNNCGVLGECYQKNYNTYERRSAYHLSTPKNQRVNQKTATSWKKWALSPGTTSSPEIFPTILDRGLKQNVYQCRDNFLLQKLTLCSYFRSLQSTWTEYLTQFTMCPRVAKIQHPFINMIKNTH